MKKTVLVFFSTINLLYCDIVSKNVFSALIKKELGEQTYLIHCIKCHKKDGSGVKEAPLGIKYLTKYKTVSDLFLYLKKTHRSYIENFDKMDDIELIFVSRFIRDKFEGK